MTFSDAQRRWGVNPATIRRWIDRKVIPAKKVRSAKGRMVWEIPDDTTCPQYKKYSIQSEKAERQALLKKGKCGYVERFAGTLSIQHMAQFLQTTPEEVRAIYDDIVAVGGM